jgi:hypothetical protein
MHPGIARDLAAQHHAELVRDAAHARRRGRRLPRWHVSFTRTVLASATAGGRSGQADGRGSSLMIIISAHRPA